MTKKPYWLLMLCLTINSCNEFKKGNYIEEKAKANLINNYEENFNTMFNAELRITPLEIYKRVESYFIMIGILDSKSKMSYKKLYEQHISSDSAPNLDCLYKYVPEVEFLYLPSNIGMNLYNYKLVTEKYENLPESSNIKKAYSALNNLFSETNVLYEDQTLIDEYFSAIDEMEFEQEIIYRAPLLAIAHANFVEKLTIETR